MNSIVLKKTKAHEEGIALISVQIECPLYVWTEVLTHRRFARNASSARAMGTERYISMGYYTPQVFYKQQQSGMQSTNEPVKYQRLARFIWNTVTKATHIGANLLERLEVTKEQRNRLVSPNKNIRAIVTGTEPSWQWFFYLRNSPHADKAMQDLAHSIVENLEKAETTFSTIHMPYNGSVTENVARSARVSYNRTKGKNDEELVTMLKNDRHLSPFEHVAYWDFNPISSCYTCKPEDFYNGYGWESERARLEFYKSKAVTD